MEAHEERLLDERERSLVRTVLIAIAVSGVVITAAVTFAVHLIAPEWGWVGALAAGGMAGFWTSVYAGGTAGSGWFQAKEEREAHAHARVPAQTATATSTPPVRPTTLAGI